MTGTLSRSVQCDIDHQQSHWESKALQVTEALSRKMGELVSLRGEKAKDQGELDRVRSALEEEQRRADRLRSELSAERHVSTQLTETLCAKEIELARVAAGKIGVGRSRSDLSFLSTSRDLSDASPDSALKHGSPYASSTPGTSWRDRAYDE